VPLAPGSRLGSYEIVAAIGAGGMGEVYRARDARLARDVAVKVLPAHVAADLELRQRFAREARALATLSHPHICPVFDVGLCFVESIRDLDTVPQRLIERDPGGSAARDPASSVRFKYMAPEQVEGSEADARTDIFAFGAVLYEMLTGRKAFDGKSQASVMAASLEREPPRLVASGFRA